MSAAPADSAALYEQRPRAAIGRRDSSPLIMKGEAAEQSQHVLDEKYVFGSVWLF